MQSIFKKKTHSVNSQTVFQVGPFLPHLLAIRTSMSELQISLLSCVSQPSKMANCCPNLKNSKSTAFFSVSRSILAVIGGLKGFDAGGVTSTPHAVGFNKTKLWNI